MNDAFEPQALRLPPEVAAQIGKKPAGKQGRSPPARMEPFLQIPHKAIVAGSGVLGGTKQFLVWLYLFHGVWADKHRTVVVANQTLSTWGGGAGRSTRRFVNWRRPVWFLSNGGSGAAPLSRYCRACELLPLGTMHCCRSVSCTVAVWWHTVTIFSSLFFSLGMFLIRRRASMRRV